MSEGIHEEAAHHPASKIAESLRQMLRDAGFTVTVWQNEVITKFANQITFDTSVTTALGQAMEEVTSPKMPAPALGIGQPRPVFRDGKPSVHDMVVTDLIARQAFGREKYGTPLQTFNGRDALHDAYEEILDLACYLRQRLAEDEWRLNRHAVGTRAHRIILDEARLFSNDSGPVAG